MVRLIVIALVCLVSFSARADIGFDVKHLEALKARGEFTQAADYIVQHQADKPTRKTARAWSEAMLSATDLLEHAEAFTKARNNAERAALALTQMGAEQLALEHLLKLGKMQVLLDDTIGAEKTLQGLIERAEKQAQRNADLILRARVEYANAAHWADNSELAWTRIEPLLPSVVETKTLSSEDRILAFMLAGRTANRTGRRAEAERWLTATVTEAEANATNPNDDTLPIALEALSRFYTYTEHHDRGVALLERASRLYAQTPYAGSRSHIVLDGNLAMALRRAQSFEKAMEVAQSNAKSAIAFIEMRQTSVEGLSNNETIAARFALEARLAADIPRWPTGSGQGDASRLTDVVTYMQLAGTSRTAQSNAVTALAWASADPQMQAALATLRQTQSRHADLNARINRLVRSGRRSEESWAMLRERDTAAREIIEQRTTLTANYPFLQQMMGLSTVSIAELQSALQPDEALVLLYPVQEQIVVAVAITRTQATWSYDTIERYELCKIVRAARQRFDPAGKISCAVPHPKLYETAVSAEDEKRATRALYDRLLRPLLPVIGAKPQWLITPYGVLIDVPYNALRTESETTDAPRWLVQDRAITVVPSPSALVQIRTRPREAEDTQATQRRLLAMGAPCIGRLSGANCQQPQLPANDKDLDDVQLNLVRDGIGQGDVDVIRQLPALPMAETELRAISGAEPISQLLIGEEATETRLKAATNQPLSTLAFATHALSAGQFGLSEPALVLTPPTTSSADDDGLLMASEIARLKLDVDWVILSACRTAASDGTSRGATLSGLARSFMEAGAPVLLVSLWQVFDQSQSEIISQAFAVRTANNKVSHSAALRLAILDYIGRDKTGGAARDSRTWGGLMIVGVAQ
jgi:CHAT domain-containing protein